VKAVRNYGDTRKKLHSRESMLKWDYF